MTSRRDFVQHVRRKDICQLETTTMARVNHGISLTCFTSLGIWLGRKDTCAAFSLVDEIGKTQKTIQDRYMMIFHRSSFKFPGLCQGIKKRILRESSSKQNVERDSSKIFMRPAWDLRHSRTDIQPIRCHRKSILTVQELQITASWFEVHGVIYYYQF